MQNFVMGRKKPGPQDVMEASCGPKFLFPRKRLSLAATFAHCLVEGHGKPRPS